MKKFDITTQNLYVYEKENLCVIKERNIISAVYEYDFNPDEYFKTEINQPDGNAYLCFSSDLNMITGEISLHYWGEFEGGETENEKKLTKKEQVFFKKIMEKSCLKFYGCNIQELWGMENKVSNNYQEQSLEDVAIKDCKCCPYGRETYDHRGCGYYTCGRPGGCYDRETYKVQTPPHDPRMGIDRNDESTWPR